MKLLRRLKRCVTASGRWQWHLEQTHADQWVEERRRQKLRSTEKMRRHDLAREVFEQPRCRHGYVGGTCSVCEWGKGNR